MKTFTISALPFVLAEAVTGVVSFSTRELRIPPTFGIGTALDTLILLAGLVVEVFRTMKTK